VTDPNIKTDSLHDSCNIRNRKRGNDMWLSRSSGSTNSTFTDSARVSRGFSASSSSRREPAEEAEMFEVEAIVDKRRKGRVVEVLFYAIHAC
jgi:hypothetical protein